MADTDKQGVGSFQSNCGSDHTKMSPGFPLVTGDTVDHAKLRYPHCVVWTPIPMLTWLCPFIGHMGIASSQGVIRDFAGPYYVSEDDMAFGNPTKYWMLPLEKLPAGTGREMWDRCVYEASEIYKGRMHNLCCDNCHSHVACALNMMKYDESTSWNMIKLTFMMLVKSKYVSVGAFLKTWLPFLIVMAIIVVVATLTTGLL